MDALGAGMGIPEPTAGQRLRLRSCLGLVEEAVLHWIVTGAPGSRADDLVPYCRDVALHLVASPLAARSAAAASH